MTYDDDFHAYIMECVNFTLPNDILFSVENLCASCRNSQHNDDCYFWSSISTIAHDDKGNDIVCACSDYKREANQDDKR